MKHFNQSDNLDTVFKGMFSLPRGMWRVYIYSFQKGNCHQIRVLLRVLHLKQLGCAILVFIISCKLSYWTRNNSDSHNSFKNLNQNFRLNMMDAPPWSRWASSKFLVLELYRLVRKMRDECEENASGKTQAAGCFLRAPPSKRIQPFACALSCAWLALSSTHLKSAKKWNLFHKLRCPYEKNIFYRFERDRWMNGFLSGWLWTSNKLSGWFPFLFFSPTMK